MFTMILSLTVAPATNVLLALGRETFSRIVENRCPSDGVLFELRCMVEGEVSIFLLKEVIEGS